MGARLRTPEDFHHFLEEVLACPHDMAPQPNYGIKDVSRLQQLSKFNMARGFAFDYMHTLLLGVVKSITLALFESCNHKSEFHVTPQGRPTLNSQPSFMTKLKLICTSLGLKRINERWLNIQVPNSFNRPPRTLEDRAYWKANEWKVT